MRRLLLLCARQKRLLLFALLLAAPLTALAGPASAVTIEWVTVGDPGNAADTPSNCAAANCGSVADPYLISKYEVTNAQYAEFLNLKAAADPHALYSTNMGSNALGGITRSGISGSYTYAVTPGFADKPVNFVSFYDSLRFTNWLNNGQGSADTETGAYTITALGITNNTITRNLGANIFLTSENEWYKAAYFDGTTYFDYPTGTNSVTSCVAPGSDTGNSANCWPATSPNGALTDVGAYALSDSPYGTFDQGGNVWEWNEEIWPEVIVGSEVISASARGVRGGSLFYGASNNLNVGPFSARSGDPANESEDVGFRVASVVPEPGTGLLVVTGLLGIVSLRGRLKPTRLRLWLSLFVCVCAAGSAGAVPLAATETLDYSNNFGAPTAVGMLDVGVNTVSGTVPPFPLGGPGAFDIDYFSVILPGGMSITAMDLVVSLYSDLVASTTAASTSSVQLLSPSSGNETFDANGTVSISPFAISGSPVGFQIRPGTQNKPTFPFTVFSTDGFSYTLNITVVPEPGSAGLLALGLVGTALARRRSA